MRKLGHFLIVPILIIYMILEVEVALRFEESENNLLIYVLI